MWLRGLFFPEWAARALLTTYDYTDKTHIAEAPLGLKSDDNGPGSEPPPHDRFRYVQSSMPSRRRPPAAVGKPPFAYFSVDYLSDYVWRPDEPLDLRDGFLHKATSYERSKDNVINHRNPRSCYIPSASAKIELFHIILLFAVRTILAVKVIIPRM